MCENEAFEIKVVKMGIKYALLVEWCCMCVYSCVCVCVCVCVYENRDKIQAFEHTSKYCRTDRASLKHADYVSFIKSIDGAKSQCFEQNQMWA